MQLIGHTILVTRAATQSMATAEEIKRRGGEAVLLPCLEMIPCPDGVAKALAALTIDPTAELLLTSINGVESLRSSVSDVELVQQIGSRRVMAVGSHTAKALHAIGLKAVAQPETMSQLGVAEWWNQHGWPQRLIFVRAQHGRKDLIALLDQHGADYQIFACYESKTPEQTVPTALLEALHHGAIDAVLLGSEATARGLIARVGIDLARRPLAVAISPRVATAATALGLRVQVVAQNASFETMLDALGRHFTA
ncbi:MAG: uroporphyrinogen-III synthase [Mariprofundales bacterium]|nr:uroporphyrinogen-III synthase [Mariprofundales bacterium]